MKPLIRWTIGGCLPQGLAVLRESILRTMAAFGRDSFDWMVCYNNMERSDLEFVQHISPRISLYEQSWKECAIPDYQATIKDADGTVSHKCEIRGGSLWKLCPARLREESHEIILDNDIVFQTMPRQIRSFLERDDTTLLLEEYLSFLGRYTPFFDEGAAYNSGLIGLPPDFDFGGELLKAWKTLGSFRNLSYADEQGLVTFVLKQSKCFTVSPETVVELHHEGRRKFINGIEVNGPYHFTGTETAVHFVEMNRMAHAPWSAYRLRECHELC